MVSAIGLNGFVVSAYPVDSADAKERIEKTENEKNSEIEIGFHAGTHLDE